MQRPLSRNGLIKDRLKDTFNDNTDYFKLEEEQEEIKEDIENRIGFVFAEDNEVVGYCCIIIGEEPAYRVIDGSWKTE